MKPLSDSEIASKAKLLHIEEVAKKIGLSRNDLSLYGDHKAKIKIDTVKKILSMPNRGKLILVSAITPTPAGEGKTTVSIGLTQGLNKIGKKAMVALREPSLGPCFGVKGGAAGGGYSQVLPMEDINLHFTGDIHAVSASHNLISSALDNYLYHGHEPHLSLRNIFWKRVMDMNDRALRQILVGLGGNGYTRETGFDITAASEIMAILCLSKNYSELKEKIGNITLGLRLADEKPFLARELNIQGAAAALLKDALLPNLVQTIENGPAFIHGGPFANIAQGANSIMATNMALRLSDYVVTEAGFGCDLGAEKFMNIVSRYGGFAPRALVLVATCRALKMHGGVNKKDLVTPNVEALKKGAQNLEKHIENAKKYGTIPVVAINRFTQDSDDELKAVQEICQRAQAECAIIDVWGKGGEGAMNLAEIVAKVVDANDTDTLPKPLYEWSEKVEDKIRTIATEVYGAKDVFYLPEAKHDLEAIYNGGFDKLPICMAKTQNSLSDNSKLLGRPRDFTMSVAKIIISSGAGFLVPLTGEIMRMPGLPKVPSANHMDIDDNGNISGLF